MNAVPSSHQPDPAELAAMYAAGALTSREAEAFEDRLLAGDPDYVREFARTRSIGEALLRSAPAIEPNLLTRSDLINKLGLVKPAPPLLQTRCRDRPRPFR